LGAMSSDLDRMIATLRRCEVLKESEVKVLCQKAMEILVEESNVQRIDSPVTVGFSRPSPLPWKVEVTAPSSRIALSDGKKCQTPDTMLKRN
jgi:hypothetical protein